MDTILIPFIDHIIDDSTVVCGDDYEDLNAFGHCFESPFRLRNEKGVIFMGYSEAEPDLILYVLVGHHKGSVYATVLTKKDIIK